jgi:hypothetical protein
MMMMMMMVVMIAISYRLVRFTLVQYALHVFIGFESVGIFLDFSSQD